MNIRSGSRRALIPFEYRDLEAWPSVDVASLGEKKRTRFYAMKSAIALYHAGVDFSEIKKRTKISENEVRREIHRCLTPDGRGSIFGFRAIVERCRVAGYERRKSTSRPKSTLSCGLSGALGRLFEEYPDLRERIESQFFGNCKSEDYFEPKKTIADIHHDFINKLKSIGLTDVDWPFNTENLGYKSLSRYLKRLLKDQPTKYVEGRHGKESARRLRVGTGVEPLLRANIPSAILELDYVMIDAPGGIVIISDPLGVEHRILAERWYVGVLADAYDGAILGVSLALERNPSADTALQTILSSMQDECYDTTPILDALLPSGRCLMPSLLPQYQRQGCCLLRVDHGWCNLAEDFVNNVIDVMGCTVEFGELFAWWMRAVVERMIGVFHARGLHRFAFTCGSGADDTRRRNPEQAAESFEVRIEDIEAIILATIYDVNGTLGKERFFGSTLLTVRTRFSADPSLGWLPRPLPKSTEAIARLLDHQVVVPVSGNAKKGIRPYLQYAKRKYTNPRIASDFSLLHKQVRLHIDRQDPRKASASLADTGEDLGTLIVERKWREWRMSLRESTMLTRHTCARPLDRGRSTPEAFLAAKADELIAKKKPSRKRGMVRGAVDYARHKRSVSTDGGQAEAPTDITSSVCPARNLFGIFRLPDNPGDTNHD